MAQAHQSPSKKMMLRAALTRGFRSSPASRLAAAAEAVHPELLLTLAVPNRALVLKKAVKRVTLPGKIVTDTSDLIFRRQRHVMILLFSLLAWSLTRRTGRHVWAGEGVAHHAQRAAAGRRARGPPGQHH